MSMTVRPGVAARASPAVARTSVAEMRATLLRIELRTRDPSRTAGIRPATTWPVPLGQARRRVARAQTGASPQRASVPAVLVIRNARSGPGGLLDVKEDLDARL